jgi:hypothetical protein
MKTPEEQIQAILQRNALKEADKAWERSWSRRLTITCIIYCTALIFLQSIHAPYFLLQALVPAGGYLFSTLSLPWMKKRWIEKYNKRN